MDCRIDKSMLNNMAVQILETANPFINSLAKSIINALIINKNNPKVSIVIGNVKMTKTGLTNTFKIAKTTATINAVV